MILYCQYNLANQENALDTSVQNLIGEFEGQEDVIALQSEVQTRFDEAVAADANLSAMITTTIPDAINGWVTQLAQAQPQPQEPAPEQPQANHRRNRYRSSRRYGSTAGAGA